MRNKDFVEIRETLARQNVILATMQSDISSIKGELIPEGKNRLGELEKDVKSLNKYKNGLIAIVTFISTMPLIKELIR